MSTYFSNELAKILIEERLGEAAEARIARSVCDCEQNRTAAPRRSILDLFRRQSPVACAC
jgi:hypothetical protein